MDPIEPVIYQRGQRLSGRAQSVSIIERFSPNSYRSPADIYFILQPMASADEVGKSNPPLLPVKLRARERSPQFDGCFVELIVKKHRAFTYVVADVLIIHDLTYKARARRWWVVPLAISVIAFSLFAGFKYYEYYIGSRAITKAEDALKDMAVSYIWSSLYSNGIVCGHVKMPYIGDSGYLFDESKSDTNKGISTDGAECVRRPMEM